MLLDLLFQSPFTFVIVFGGLIIAIGMHEAAHCFMADHLGDPTPRSMGRTTLNPFAHLDPIGTLAILFTGFGWGKPSPIDPYNLQNPKKDTMLIAAAGPLSNFAIAALIALLLRLINPPMAVYSAAAFVLIININLALFNLIPIAPLDGSKVVGNQTARPNVVLLLLFILPIFGGHSLAGLIISPISNFLLGLLLPLS